MKSPRLQLYNEQCDTRSPETKRRYQLGMADQVWQAVERANESAYGKGKRTRHYDGVRDVEQRRFVAWPTGSRGTVGVEIRNSVPHGNGTPPMPRTPNGNIRQMRGFVVVAEPYDQAAERGPKGFYDAVRPDHVRDPIAVWRLL